ncbi:MAG TPA: thiamine pyrophosphate-dependent enzyme [Coxiellaceae bacterium]|nr:MAG: hypothetical protein A3E81_05570 [Gammaproteobacteria bacterium RIFCSPHIGHO2_12_FULL_36_30]HLB56987.1 thiamine pyrophosphate-dependent enzyme [Coxiellaceae bacterium]
MSKTLSDQVVDILAQAGIKRAYGIPGDATNLILASIFQRNDFDFILTRHEEGAGFMASAHAKLTGEMGVVLACQGPGTAHMLEAMYDAKLDKAPMLVITGQVESDVIGTHTVQEINQILLFADVAAFNREVRSANNLISILQLAIQTVKAKKIVAHISIAADVLREPAIKNVLPQSSVYDMPYHVVPDLKLIIKSADILNQYKNVTILYGAGTLRAKKELMAVADLLAAPIVHTVRSKDIIDNNNPHYAGGIGYKGSKNGCHFVKDCDALLIVGCSFAWKEFYPDNVPIIQIDLDPERIGVRCHVEVGLIGDAKLTLAELARHLKQKENKDFLEEAKTAHAKAIEKLHDTEKMKNAKRIGSPILTDIISRNLKSDAIVTVDAGGVSIWANNWLQLNGKQRLIGSAELSTMGFGMPAAIGCQLAMPDRQVVALCGDGGFHMTMPDFATAVKYNLPITVIVYNSFSYHLIELEQLKEGVAQCYTKLSNPDYAKIAEAHGVPGFTAKTIDEVEPAIRAAFASGKPCIVDVHVDPDELIKPNKITLSLASHFAMSMLKTKIAEWSGKE